MRTVTIPLEEFDNMRTQIIELENFIKDRKHELKQIYDIDFDDLKEIYNMRSRTNLPFRPEGF